MSPRSVQPSASPRDLGFSTDESAVYEFATSDELPLVNMARSVRSVWIHGNAERIYVRVMNRLRHLLIGGFAVGQVVFWVVLVVPARLGGWLSILPTVLIAIMSVTYSLALRYDIVCLVVRTYEFWFFSVSNLASAVLLAFYLGDLRASMAFALWFVLQNNIFTDANTVFRRGYVKAAIAALLFLLYLITMILLGSIDGTNEVELLRIDASRRLLAEDALIQGYSTQAIMLARNIFRRWTTRAQPRATSAGFTHSVTCVTLRARLRLRRNDQWVVRSISPVPRVESSCSPEATASAVVRMVLVPLKARFRVDQTTVSIVRSVLFTDSAARRRGVRMIVLACAYSGLGLTIPAVVFPIESIRAIAFVCSVVFMAVFLATTQRRLLWRLVGTFDFVFLSFQLLVVHMSLCDMLGWGSTSLPIVTSWLWVQWILTVDAITPVMKVKWGVRHRLPVIIMVLFIASQVFIFVAIVSDRSMDLRNRVLISFRMRGQLLEMKVIPMLLSRMVILFGWSWKVLWYMWRLRPDELLMIQGTMTYPNRHRQRKIDAATISPTR